jgi:NO-binding membrane sensor protein with MHYT domain/signal transduction histidine kinase
VYSPLLPITIAVSQHTPLTASYDPAIVAVSVLVAVLASYVALDLAARVAAATNTRARIGWNVGGAMAMGCGIWSMHFIAMLALRLPVPVRYHVGLALLSLLVAVVAGGLALAISSRRSLAPTTLLVGSACMGGAIAGMHYTGMAAITSPIAVHYHSGFWWLSVVIAVAASYVALLLAFRLKHHDGLWIMPRAAAATVMGAAIAGMHYTGMAAAHFTAVPGSDVSSGLLATRDLAVAVTIGACLILGLAFFSAIVSVQQRRHDERQRHWTEEMLRQAAAALSETGPRFFPAVVRELVRTLDADFASIGEIMPDRPTVVRALAACRRGVLVDALEYDLPGSPSEYVITHGLTAFASGVADRFPNDVTLARVQANGYIATPLLAANGTAIGVMAIVSSRPLQREAHARVLLQIFAARVSGELQHLQTERELRASEQTLFQSQKLEAIGRLAGGLAHDFNNLLSIMIGSAEVALDQLDLNSVAAHRVRELMNAAKRAGDLTARLLAFSRQQVLHPRRVSVNDALRSLEPILARTLGSRIAVDLRPSPAPAVVVVDPVQLDQVLLNLVINARDAMPDGGTVRIPVTLDGGEVIITVGDTGIGMTDETKARIFEPFFTTKGTRGTGLGLPTVYGIVKQSGGSVECDTALGAGTVFRVRLPAAEPIAPAGLPALRVIAP